tara:strand:- start:1674 stop:2360 length:687 start_codon:yes stop_codon:yes gene_type:complete
MVYFLGRDVSVVLTTESVTDTETVGISGNAAVAGATATNAGILFADDMSETTFSNYTEVADLTGVDISIGAMDEDITFIGQKGTGKVEQKKEITITLTRKKNDNCWDIMYNGPTDGTFLTNFTGTQYWGARWGLDGNGAKLGDGFKNPKDIVDAGNTTKNEFGFRVHVQMKNGSEIIAIPNCMLTEYTTTLGPDAVQEESLTFMTNQTILQSSNAVLINKTQTLKADY